MNIKEKLDKEYKDYLNKYNIEPSYVYVDIKYLDDVHTIPVIIKLLDSYTNDEEDSQIFYYCTGINDLLSLCNKGSGDFIITDFYYFF